MCLRKGLTCAEPDREESDDPVVRPHETELTRGRPGLLAHRRLDRALVHLRCLARRGLRQRLEMRTHRAHLRHRVADRALDLLRDCVCALEAQVAR